ncbi:MAG: ferredoxin:protochlorophyllide reductase (ATP-dependent) subunit N [Chloroflexaceae bacterium]|nr:ferredoxin:protochlorophyllide reductase (ATP-dependent) subunit N [Chloroflexaceae bacterium]
MARKPEIIREHNLHHSFCGLVSVGWLYQKIKDSFFLILGTHTCAHLLQNTLGVMIFARPRFAVALMEEADLSSAQPALEAQIEAIRREHHPSVIFLLSSCTPEVIKVEFEGLAQSLSRPDLPVLFVPASGLDYTFSQAEDSVLQALLPLCPVSERDTPEIVFLGSVNDTIADDFAHEAACLGLPVAGFLPSNHMRDLPAIGPNTIIAPLHPYLARVANLLQQERGATVLSSLFPLGPDGTRMFWEDLARAFGQTIDLADREAAAWERLKTHTSLLKGKRIFLASDTLMEIPLARFLQACGCEIVECSTPYVNRRFHAHELSRLEEVRLVEQPDLHHQLERIDEIKPDLVIANIMSTNPLIGHGVLAKWSMEVAFMPIHGWAGSHTLISMFTLPMQRHAQLNARGTTVMDPLWTTGLMPSQQEHSA